MQHAEATYLGSGLKATYYGDPLGAGATNDGACLWGNVQPAFGTNVVAAGPAIFNNREGCGLCFDVSCDSSRDSWKEQQQPGPDCIAGSIRVYVTNLCPECDANHIDLSMPVFLSIAEQRAGIIPITMTPCGQVDKNKNPISGSAGSVSTSSKSAQDSPSVTPSPPAATPSPTAPPPTNPPDTPPPTNPPQTPSPTNPPPTNPPQTPSPTNPPPTNPPQTPSPTNPLPQNPLKRLPN
ncbi:Expansin [Klebsormidium nitens]|uniref:Expansin n=1 Tax=Klebsormidium nitens TaxID=105231 RepID=A0A1Y1HY19_KLENI|nr:Expansin [Klebsormidium nitens]|eukprot:GAQ81437.1 Expansin [Klebsormidium nitens]